MYWDWVSPLALEKVMLAHKLTQSGKTLAAVQSLIAAAEIEPTWFAPHFALGSCFASIGDHEEAMPAHKKAISLEPGFPATHYNLAQSCKALGNFPEAVLASKCYIALRPTDPDGYFILATIYMRMQRPTEEVESYLATLRLDPNHLLANMNLAVSYAEFGKRALAVHHFGTVIRLAPKSDVGRKATELLDSLGHK